MFSLLMGLLLVTPSCDAYIRACPGGRPQPDRSRSPIDYLSDRELEVFRLIGSGRGTRQIAEQLHLSVKTVETYRAHIKEKLNLASATELMRAAVQWVDGLTSG